MEKLFSPEYGVAGICVLLTINILVKLGEFLWSLKQKKESASDATIEKLIQTVKENTYAIEHLEKSVSELPKMKTDLRRFFAAVKAISGDKWSQIKKEILEDDLIL